MSVRKVCPPDHGHAINSTCRSLHHCKCDACTDRARRYENWRSKQTDLLVSSVGTKRRVRALNRLGWSSYALSERLGKAPCYVASLLRNDLVSRRTAAVIARLFDELCMTVPPVSASSVRTRNYAARMGWPPPLAWDDDIDDPAAVPARTGEAA